MHFTAKLSIDWAALATQATWMSVVEQCWEHIAEARESNQYHTGHCGSLKARTQKGLNST